jgi:adenine-specific DNA methylase
MMVKFLPSYVGSKAYWISYLNSYHDMDFVELFAGSSVLSANLAKTALLNDIDPYVYLMLSQFDKLVVPEVFTQKDVFLWGI